MFNWSKVVALKCLHLLKLRSLRHAGVPTPLLELLVLIFGFRFMCRTFLSILLQKIRSNAPLPQSYSCRNRNRVDRHSLTINQVKPHKCNNTNEIENPGLLIFKVIFTFNVDIYHRKCFFWKLPPTAWIEICLCIASFDQLFSSLTTTVSY